MKTKLIVFCLICISFVYANNLILKVDKNFTELINKLTSKKVKCINFKGNRFAVVADSTTNFIYFTADYASVTGYQGVTNCAVFLNSNLDVQKVKVINSEDTRSFVRKVKSGSFLKQFVNFDDTKKITSVTGATLTSNAIKKSISKSLKKIKPIIKNYAN